MHTHSHTYIYIHMQCCPVMTRPTLAQVPIEPMKDEKHLAVPPNPTPKVQNVLRNWARACRLL